MGPPMLIPSTLLVLPLLQTLSMQVNCYLHGGDESIGVDLQLSDLL